MQELQGRLRACTLDGRARARRRSWSHSPDETRCSSPSRQLPLEVKGCQPGQSPHLQPPAGQSRHSSPGRERVPGTTDSASCRSPGLTRVSDRQHAQLPAEAAAAAAPGSTTACAGPARRTEQGAGTAATQSKQDATPAGGVSEHQAVRLTPVGAEQAACVSAAGGKRSAGGQPVQPGRQSSSQPGVAAAPQLGLAGPACEGWRACCSMKQAPSKTASRPCWVPPSRSPDKGSHHSPAMVANCPMGIPQPTILQPSSEGQRRSASRKAFSALHRLQVGFLDVVYMQRLCHPAATNIDQAAPHTGATLQAGRDVRPQSATFTTCCP